MLQLVLTWKRFGNMSSFNSGFEALRAEVQHRGLQTDFHASSHNSKRAW